MKLIFSLLAVVLAFTAAHPASARSRNRSYGCPYNIPTFRYFFCRGRSPLVVQFSQNPEQIDLTSIKDGVQFDILGVPGQKQQISWFTLKSVNNNYFLALPNSRGEVNGINELFGNNTTGPDDRKAGDGFGALRKWDRNGDSVIDERDPIFDRLRLWSDTNLNGIAEEWELHPLKKLGIESISLAHRYGNFSTDKHGNQQTMPSTIKTHDGPVAFMFDLWFRTMNR